MTTAIRQVAIAASSPQVIHALATLVAALYALRHPYAGMVSSTKANSVITATESVALRTAFQTPATSAVLL